MEKAEAKADIKKRLNRIEGQIKGIQKMIDNDEECNSILIQIAAVRAAVNKVGGLILENYAQCCIREAALNSQDDKAVSELIDTIIKFTK